MASGSTPPTMEVGVPSSPLASSTSSTSQSSSSSSSSTASAQVSPRGVFRRDNNALLSSTLTSPDPLVVAAVKLVASTLNDHACGVAVMARQQSRKHTLLTKQINKMKKARKFKGCDAVEWMRVNFGITREEALWLGQLLFEWEYVVSKTQTEFLDGSFKYFFQDAEGAYDDAARSTPKQVGKAVAQLLLIHTQGEARPRGSFLHAIPIESQEEYEARQAEKLGTANAFADSPSNRDRRDFPVEGSGWLGRNMRKVRARRDRGDERSIDLSSDSLSSQLSSSPTVIERMDSSDTSGSLGTRTNNSASAPGGGQGSQVITLEADRSGQHSSGLWPMVEEDTAEIRFMPADRPEGVPRVKAATPDKLVEWLTSAKYSDAKFRDAFMLTYRSFMSPQELLRKLLHRYMGKFEVTDPYLSEEELEQQQHLIRIKVVMVLKHWMKEHGYDFRKESRDSGGTGDIHYELETFITDILPLYMKPAAEQLRKTFEIWEAEYQAQRASLAAQSETVALKAAKELNIDDVDLTVLAQQMCLVEHELWRKIRPSECLNKAWSSNDKKHTMSPNILAIIKRFNKMSAWVTSQVVNKVKLTDRVNTVKKLITLGKKLAEANNFNGVMQVMSGLNSSPVARLKKTWEVVNKESDWEDTYRHLSELTSHDSSYKLYRAALHGSVPPCVPYLGVYLTDLTFIEDGNPDRVDGLINWNKNQMTAAVITEIRFYQTPPYTYPVVSEIYDMLQNMPFVEDEAVAYTLSLKVEPRDTTEAIETLLMDEAKLKHQIQSLQVRIADLEMENKRLNEQNAHLLDIVKDAHRRSYKTSKESEQSEPMPDGTCDRNRAGSRTLSDESQESKEASFFARVKRAAAPTDNPFQTTELPNTDSFTNGHNTLPATKRAADSVGEPSEALFSSSQQQQPIQQRQQHQHRQQQPIPQQHQHQQHQQEQQPVQHQRQQQHQYQQHRQEQQPIPQQHQHQQHQHQQRKQQQSIQQQPQQQKPELSSNGKGINQPKPLTAPVASTTKAHAHSEASSQSAQPSRGFIIRARSEVSLKSSATMETAPGASGSASQSFSSPLPSTPDLQGSDNTKSSAKVDTPSLASSPSFPSLPIRDLKFAVPVKGTVAPVPVPRPLPLCSLPTAQPKPPSPTDPAPVSSTSPPGASKRSQRPIPARQRPAAPSHPPSSPIPPVPSSPQPAQAARGAPPLRPQPGTVTAGSVPPVPPPPTVGGTPN